MQRYEKGKIRVWETTDGLVWWEEHDNIVGKWREITKFQVMNGFSSKLRSSGLTQ